MTKKFQSIDSIEKKAYGINKDLVRKKEEIKHKKNNEAIQKCLILMILKKKT